MIRPEDLHAPWYEPRSAYVHIPFCAYRCGYCDFAIAVGRDAEMDRYLDALEQELTQLGSPRPIETLFIGGGTPTHLRAPQLQRLMDMLNSWFPRQSPRCEVSIEANPESLDPEKLAILTQAGLTRVSIGVQSFQSALLQNLDRVHGYDQVENAVRMAREYLLAVSLDLIFAAPGSTLHTWQADLEQALALSPDHISTYGLTYEKGTPLWKRRQRGELQLVQEEEECEMYSLSMNLLTRAGFDHYEISNFARPGQRCQHNERYWANEAYYGVGLGAARYVRFARELNHRNLDEYLNRLSAGESPTYQREVLDPRERARETFAVQLRRCDGIDREAFFHQTGYSLDELISERLVSLIRHGLLADTGERVFLTHEGKFVADAVITDLLKSP